VDVPAARVVFSAADRSEIAGATAGILASGALTLGPYTRRFEAEFAAAHTSGAAAPHAVATSSGTAALEIALRVTGATGRDVIVPADTFFATAAAVMRGGGRPVFADIDAATFALSRATVEAALTPATAAVVLVHIGGLISPEADALAQLCEERGIALIEDAAHAHGSTYGGRFAGSFGRAAAFSFYPTKVVTSGEGGMVVTASRQLADEARIYRDQGKGTFTANHHIRLGSAFRMSELNAATGVVHLRRMSEFIAHRRSVAARYTEKLSRVEGLQPLIEPDGSRSNFYKYILLLPPGVDRERAKKELAGQYGVRLSGEVYDLPLHRQPFFADDAQRALPRLPVTEDVCARHVCLPVHSDMGDDEVEHVVTAVSRVCGSLTGI
jgi:dTDP-4-amino-4,6-dideoxygalactose transaminase